MCLGVISGAGANPKSLTHVAIGPQDDGLFNPPV
jgi:hypothetical protein